MLKSVTGRFRDKSTAKQFEFEFYCDCCGKAISTPVLEFINGFADDGHITAAEAEARDILYAFEHRNAYERANIEARYELDKCEICGDMVCQDCSVFTEENGHTACCKCIKNKK